jgi:opacity protein-like surface antigen
MIRRLVLLGGAIAALSVGARASGFIDRFSLRVTPMGMLTLGGHYSDTDKLSAIVDMGGGLAAGLRFELSKNAYLDAGYGYVVLPVKSAMKPFDFRHTSSFFDMSAATLNLSLFLKSGYMIEPFLSLGGGLYPWAFRQKIIGGKTWGSPAKPQTSLSDSSLGIHFGLGVEVSLFVRLSAVVEFRYTYIYSRNVPRFGTDDFTQQDFLGLQLGVIYYLGKR